MVKSLETEGEVTGPPTWQQEFPITGPDHAVRAMVGVTCMRMPTDGFIAAIGPGDVRIPKTAINTPNMQLSVPFDMPADYQGNMLISYWKGKTPPPMGANIEPFVSI
jgi:hypothetical protein